MEFNYGPFEETNEPSKWSVSDELHDLNRKFGVSSFCLRVKLGREGGELENGTDLDTVAFRLISKSH